MMSSIKFIFAIAIVANSFTAYNFGTEMETALLNIENKDVFYNLFASVLAHSTYIKLPTTDAISGFNVYKNLKTQPLADENLVILYNKNPTEVFTEIFNKYWTQTLDGTIIYNEDFLQPISYYLNVTVLRLLSANAIAEINSKFNDKKIAKKMTKYLRNSFDQAFKDNAKVFEIVQSDLKTAIESMATKIFFYQLKDYIDYTSKSMKKIISAIHNLIIKNNEKEFNDIKGQSSTDRIMFLVDNLIKLDKNRNIAKDELETWAYSVKYLVKVLNAKRNDRSTKDYDEGYKNWNIDVTQKLLNVLPLEDAVELIREVIRSITNDDKPESSYNSLLEDELKDDQIVFDSKNTTDPDVNRLKIADLISNPKIDSINLKPAQMRDLVSDFSNMLKLKPNAYRSKPFTNGVVETFGTPVDENPFNLPELINQSLKTRLNGDPGVVDGNIGDSIDVLLTDNSDNKENLLNKLQNIIANLINKDVDKDIDVYFNNEQAQYLKDKLDTVPQLFNLVPLLNEMYVYRDEERKVPKGFNVTDNLYKLNHKRYKKDDLVKNLGQPLNEEKDPQVDLNEPVVNKIIEDEPFEKNESIKLEEPLNQKFNEEPEVIIIDEVKKPFVIDTGVEPQLIEDLNKVPELDTNSLINPNTFDMEDIQLPFPLNTDNTNLVIEVFGSIGNENVKVLERVINFASYTIETKYLPLDQNTDVEVTIVYVETPDSGCLGKNHTFA